MPNNYYSRDIPEKTFELKKHYANAVFVKFLDNVFTIRKNNTLPSFTCFIKQKGELFGDVLPVQSVEGIEYFLRIHNSSNNIILNEKLSVVDENLGELEYVFSAFDLDYIGHFTAQIISKNNNLESVIGETKINVI